MLHKIGVGNILAGILGFVLGFVVRWTLPGIVDLQTGATVALVAVTAVYVLLTHEIAKASEASARASRDMADRMADSLRPMVVPVASFKNASQGKDGYVRIVHFSKVGTPPPTSGDVWEPLFLRNVGPGPAINVGIVLKGIPSNGGIPPGKGGARPIPAGGREQAYHWCSGADVQVWEGSKLTITYDDILGRHFETTALRALHDWYDVQTRQTDRPGPPRQYGNSMGIKSGPDAPGGPG